MYIHMLEERESGVSNVYVEACVNVSLLRMHSI